MAEPVDLESLYREAQSALKARDYDRAATLLKQILLVDENYRDTSRLLAHTVKSKRRRWYNDLRVWGSVIGILIIGLLAWWVSTLNWKALVPPPAATATRNPLLVATLTLEPSVDPHNTFTPTLFTTPVPLAWKRIYLAKEFQRDSISAIVFDPKDADILYVGTQNAGIFKSIDAGMSWKPVQNGLSRAGIYSLIIDNTNPSILFAGVSNGGVYKTMDGGDHWNAMNEGITNFECCKYLVIMDPAEPNQLLYSDGSRLYASSDAAETWSLIKDEYTCPDEIAALAWHPKDSSLVFATNNHSWGGCSQSGVYRSADGGHTWSPPTLEITRPSEKGLFISQQTGENLYVHTEEGRLFVSHDAGANWAEEQGCGSLILDPQNESNIYCASDVTLLKYGDFPGKTDKWWPVAPLPVKVELWTPPVISPHSSQTMVFGKTQIWYSLDGGLTWNERNNGLGAGRIELRVDPVQPSTLYADDGNCQPFFSTDSGGTWEKATKWGCGMSMSQDGKARYWLEAAQASATLHISTDSGSTWTLYTFQQQIFSVVAHPTIPGKVYAISRTNAPTYVYVSSDYGQTWQKSAGINKLVGGGMFFSNGPNQRIYIVSSDWQFYASEDLGKNWQEYITQAMHASSDATRMVIAPSDSNHLTLATLGRGILISTDGGQNWQESNAGLGSLFVNTLATDSNHPDTLYAGTDGGAYVSFDGGGTWGQINDGLLGATVVYSIVVDKDSNVYAATPYGIFRLESH